MPFDKVFRIVNQKYHKNLTTFSANLPKSAKTFGILLKIILFGVRSPCCWEFWAQVFRVHGSRPTRRGWFFFPNVTLQAYSKIQTVFDFERVTNQVPSDLRKFFKNLNFSVMIDKKWYIFENERVTKIKCRRHCL